MYHLVVTSRIGERIEAENAIYKVVLVNCGDYPPLVTVRAKLHHIPDYPEIVWSGK